MSLSQGGECSTREKGRQFTRIYRDMVVKHWDKRQLGRNICRWERFVRIVFK